MKLEISERQARVLIDALDAYSSLQMGQMRAIADVIEGAKDKDGDPLPDAWTIREQWTDKLSLEIFHYHPSTSHGICSKHVPDSGKIAYDLQCVIRRPLSSGGDVWSGEPLHTCRDEPLAKVIE